MTQRRGFPLIHCRVQRIPINFAGSPYIRQFAIPVCLDVCARAENWVVAQEWALQTEETLCQETAAPRVLLILIRGCPKHINSIATSFARAVLETADTFRDTVRCTSMYLLSQDGTVDHLINRMSYPKLEMLKPNHLITKQLDLNTRKEAHQVSIKYQVFLRYKGMNCLECKEYEAMNQTSQ